MKVDGKHYRTIWVAENNDKVIRVIDQRHLPHRFVIEDLCTVSDMACAIREMHIRGAGVIGAGAGYGMYLAALEAAAANENDFMTAVRKSADALIATRPTAVNLEWAVRRQLAAIADVDSIDDKIAIARRTADTIADEDAEWGRRIGLNGLAIIEKIAEQKQGQPVNILTHCNAGWLALVDYGSATSPVYAAHDAGIPVHVWVDETRPRNQGARLTAWEMQQNGVPHTVIVDNAGGHLMQNGMVDMVITGADRVTRIGDVANKIGTYLKALAAYDNDIPFYVALPSSSFDWTMRDGLREVPVEQRDENEVKYIQGAVGDSIETVLLTPKDSPAANYAFDITQARLVTAFITDRGICGASEESLMKLYPEARQS